jgi:primary-amine oxidase
VGAQTTPRATTELIQAALESMQMPFTRGKDSFQFKLNDRLTTLEIMHNGNKLLIRTALGGTQATLATLNRYYEELAITTRAVRYAQSGVMLEAGLDCRLGVTAKSLAHFVAGFGKDLREFEGFLAKAGPAPGTADGVADAVDPDEKLATDNKPNSTRPVSVKPSVLPLAVTPGSGDKEITVEFPTDGSMPHETAWKIRWDMKDGEAAAKEGFKVDGRSESPVLFRVKQAFFRPGAKTGWVQVLADAHPSEFYVPYFFQHTRFFDLRYNGTYGELNAKDGGPRSRLLGKDKRVMAEVRDRGLAYKHGDVVRRGEELVLWANFVAGNYTYLIEFCFHDDGTVAFKHAPTGYNFFEHFETAAHMHNCLWRIGVKLAPAGTGKANNQVSLVKLPYDPKELGEDGKLAIQPIAHESFHDFEPKEFTRLRVSNPSYSVFPASEDRPRPVISYDLVPLTQGIARHHRFDDERFSLHDFWVTRSDCPEKMYIKLPDYFDSRKTPRPLAGSDGVVLWHMSSALHVPRGEDGIYAGNSLKNGQALVSFTNVELRPRNLFAATPLYPRLP